jgi:hypothetical protein
MATRVALDKAKLTHLLTHTGAQVQRYVSDGTEYGIYQELGTERQGYAQPFMRPAVEAVRAGWEGAFAGQLTNEQVRAVVTKVAFDIEGIAKQLAPVDTGNLHDNIGVSEEMPGGGRGVWFSIDLPWLGGA